MALSSRALSVAILSVLIPACGGDDPTPPPESSVDILDPAVDHYGKSYADWAGGWVQWLGDTAPPDCVNPASDTTGAACAEYQDADSDVFYLAGNHGGVSIRDECVVPAGKALFFPLINTSADNAGVPPELVYSDAELIDYVESNFALFDVESLRLEVDGHSIDRLARTAIDLAPYTIDLAPEANIYTCQMVDGVEGEFTGFLSGYFAMLGPLDPGQHTIAFGASAQGQSITIDVTYELTVE